MIASTRLGLPTTSPVQTAASAPSSDVVSGSPSQASNRCTARAGSDPCVAQAMSAAVPPSSTPHSTTAAGDTVAVDELAEADEAALANWVSLCIRKDRSVRLVQRHRHPLKPLPQAAKIRLQALGDQRSQQSHALCRRPGLHQTGGSRANRGAFDMSRTPPFFNPAAELARSRAVVRAGPTQDPRLTTDTAAQPRFFRDRGSSRSAFRTSIYRLSVTRTSHTGATAGRRASTR